MKNFLISLLCGCFVFTSLYGVRTQSIAHEKYFDFIEGNFKNVSLGNQGSLQLAPGLLEVAELPEPIIWGGVVDSQGNLYLATGNNGTVLKVSPQGEVSNYFSPDKILTHAIAIDSQDNLYVGTSPRGRVYRISPGRLPEIYFDSDEEYIWDLISDEDGNLFVATGSPANIYKISPGIQTGDEAELWFSCPQTHLTKLAWDSEGQLLAGSSPDGVLYRIENKDKAYALYNSGAQEIKSIVAKSDGTLFFSTFNRKGGDKSAESSLKTENNASMSTYSVTVSGKEGNSNHSKTPPSAVKGGSSRIYRIDNEGFVEPVWESHNFNIYSFILYANQSLLIGTNDKGRLYSVLDRSEWSLLQQTPDGGELTVLIPDPIHPDSVLAVSSNPAKIYRLQSGKAETGVFTSAAIDIKQIVKWGNLLPVTDNSVTPFSTFRTRSGNTEDPDDTWNDWADVEKNNGDWVIKSSHARYLQYEIAFPSESTPGQSKEKINHVRLFYQSRNSAPFIESIRLLPIGLKLIQMPAVVRNIDLKKFLEEGDPHKLIAERIPRQQLKQMGEEGLLSVGWKAVDPNGDNLEFTLLIKKDGDETWITLEEKMEISVTTINTKGFDEGNYHLKLVASDAPDNEPGQELSGFRLSELFLIDNSPPEIIIHKHEIQSDEINLQFSVADNNSILREVFYQLDGKSHKSIRPDDGLFDSTRENFTLNIDDLASGGHSLLLEAVDELGNSAILTVPFKVGN